MQAMEQWGHLSVLAVNECCFKQSFTSLSTVSHTVVIKPLHMRLSSYIILIDRAYTIEFSGTTL